MLKACLKSSLYALTLSCLSFQASHSSSAREDEETLKQRRVPSFRVADPLRQQFNSAFLAVEKGSLLPLSTGNSSPSPSRQTSHVRTKSSPENNIKKISTRPNTHPKSPISPSPLTRGRLPFKTSSDSGEQEKKGSFTKPPIKRSGSCAEDFIKAHLSSATEAVVRGSPSPSPVNSPLTVRRANIHRMTNSHPLTKIDYTAENSESSDSRALVSKNSSPLMTGSEIEQTPSPEKDSNHKKRKSNLMTISHRENKKAKNDEEESDKKALEEKVRRLEDKLKSKKEKYRNFIKAKALELNAVQDREKDVVSELQEKEQRLNASVLLSNQETQRYTALIEQLNQQLQQKESELQQSRITSTLALDQERSLHQQAINDAQEKERDARQEGQRREEELNERLRIKQQELADHMARVRAETENQTNISQQLNQQLAASLQTNVTLTQSLAQKDTDNQTLSASLVQLQKNIQALSQTERDMLSWKTKAEAAEQEKNTLQKRVNQIDQEKSSLQAQITQLQVLKQKQDQFNQVEQDLRSWKTKAEAAEQEKNALQKRVNQIDQEKSSLQAQITSLQQQTQTLQTRLNQYIGYERYNVRINGNGQLARVNNTHVATSPWWVTPEQVFFLTHIMGRPETITAKKL